MKSKHTPGPWKKGDKLDANGNVRISGGTYDIVAVASGDFVEEIDANARLIAAAPDLLLACQDQVKSCPYCQGDMEGDSCASCAGIKAAIKKATGGR